MAGQLTSEVRLGAPKVGGYAFSAPIGSTRPTTADAALDAAYIDLGYVSEDGIEIATENGVTKIKDWNLDTIAAIQESNECTITLTLMQKSVASTKEVFGEGNVVATGDTITAVHYTGEILPHKQYAFPMKDGKGPQILDIGDGQITGLDGLSFKKNEVVRFPVTIECFKDKDGRFFTLHGA